MKKLSKKSKRMLDDGIASAKLELSKEMQKLIRKSEAAAKKGVVEDTFPTPPFWTPGALNARIEDLQDEVDRLDEDMESVKEFLGTLLVAVSVDSSHRKALTKKLNQLLK